MSHTRQNVVDVIKARLRRLSTTALDADIVVEMIYVQEYVLELAEFRPWFLETINSAITAAAAASSIAVPTDFLAEVEKGSFWVQNPTTTLWEEVGKDDYDALVNSADYATPGITKKFALVGNNIYIFPTTDIGYTYRWVYAARQPGLTLTTSTNDWLEYAMEWFINEVAAKIARYYLSNVDAAKSFEEAAVRGKAMLYTAHEARQHVNRDYKMGDD